MDSPAFSELQKTLKHKFGRFYFRAKLCKVPKLEDLMIRFGPRGEVETELLITDFASSVWGFIYWFEKEHGRNAELRWNKLMIRIKNLSESKKGMVLIMQQIFTIPMLVKSEIFRKDHAKVLRKAECQRHQRKQKKEINKYERAIKTINELDPDFDKDSKYLKLAKQHAEDIKPSATFLTLKSFQNYGLMYHDTQERKSTKGLQLLTDFVCKTYELAKEYSNLTSNAIYTEIGKLLDLLKIKNLKEENYTRETIRQIINRHYSKYVLRHREVMRIWQESNIIK
jgi:hypothetical protein